MVVRLIEASDGAMGELEILDSLCDLAGSEFGPVLPRESGLLLWVLMLLGREWLYSGMLGSISALSLAESFATLLPLGIGAVSVRWPYRLGGCWLRVLFCSIFAVAPVFVRVELPPRVEDRLGAMMHWLECEAVSGLAGMQGGIGYSVFFWNGFGGKQRKTRSVESNEARKPDDLLVSGA